MNYILFWLYCCVLSLAAANNVLRRQSGDFSLQSPRAGDIFALASRSDRARLNIAWTVPEDTADRDVYISLVQGDNTTSLDLVRVVNGTAPNNGSYTWYADNSVEGLLAGFRASFPSGCNYSIEVRVLSLRAYSGYFTIVNPDDGGLGSNASCPDTDAQTSAPSDSPQSPEATGGGSSGASKTTIIVAVVVPVVVIGLIIAAIVWYGMRKGWFAKTKKKNAPATNFKPEHNWEVSDQSAEFPKQQEQVDRDTVGELDGKDAPQMLENNEPHELEGSTAQRH